MLWGWGWGWGGALSADIMEGNLCGKDRQSNCQAWALKRNKEEQWRRLQWRSGVTEAARTHGWRCRGRGRVAMHGAPCKPHTNMCAALMDAPQCKTPTPSSGPVRSEGQPLFRPAITFPLLFSKSELSFLKGGKYSRGSVCGLLRRGKKTKKLAADTEAEGQTKTSASTAARITSLLTSLQSHAASFVNVSCLEWDKINLILPSPG